MTLDPGARLGTYEILGPLGSGGMGEVYRARDRKLGREVALKILSEAFASEPDRIARFEREARMLAAVNHPAIAAIYGAEVDGDFRYIVMELVPGQTLAEKLDAGPLPVSEALGLAGQMAEALSVAHEKGVIHRDLKPANIKVTPEGRVKVLDLGLAKAMEVPRAAVLSNSPTVVLDESRPGSLLGTPGYMSPEQARGKETDRRTDVWAFGCVLFEMLTGKRAFPGDSVPDILLAILDREPEWKALPAAAPPRVGDLLRRCLEKDPNRRLRDAGDIRIEIERALEEVARPGAPVLSALARTWKPAAAVLGGLAVVAATWTAVRSSPAASLALPEHKQLAVLPFRNLTGDENASLMGIGMVETVSVRLSGLPGLQVVTPTAAVAVAEKESEILSATRDLGANLVLLGTLQRVGDRVRITYRVVNVRDGIQIAANSLDGSASDIFDLQDKLANSVAKDLLLPGVAPRKPTPSGLETASQQEAYLRAIGLLQRYDQKASVDQAVVILTTLAAETPASALVHAALGRAYLYVFQLTRQKDMADRAVKACERAGRLDDRLPEVQFTLGQLHAKTGKPLEAIAEFENGLTLQPNSIEAVLGLAAAYQAAGRASDAETAFHRAISLQPNYWAPHNQLGAFYYRQGNYEAAARMFERVIKLMPNSVRGFNNLGAAYQQMDRFDAAREAYATSARLEPSDGAFTNLGTLEFFLGRYREAAKAFVRATELTPGKALYWSNLGDAYRWIPGQRPRSTPAYERAIALARSDLKINPQDGGAHATLGLCLSKTGSPAEGFTHAQAALGLEPSNPDFLYDLAVVSTLLDRKQDAIGYVRRAVAAGLGVAQVEREPEFESLRSLEAFQEILRSPRKTA